MALLRFLPFLFTFFLSFHLSASQHNSSLSDEYAQQWFNQHIEMLHQEDAQLVMNVLYLLYANSIIELEIRRFFTPMSQLIQSTKTKTFSYSDPAEDLTMLKTLIERLSYIASARTIYNQMLTQCFEHYNKKSACIKRLTPALESVQSYGSLTLMNWSNENDDKINLNIKITADNLAEGARYLQEMSDFFNKLNNGILPINTEEDKKNLACLDIFLQNSSTASTTIENLLDAINTNTDQTTELISVAHRMFKAYYEALYSYMQTEDFDKKYATTLFSMHGLLPHEYRSELPDSQHIFEHVLKTTKLYTKTELLHS